jgi:hypothetical protein
MGQFAFKKRTLLIYAAEYPVSWHPWQWQKFPAGKWQAFCLKIEEQAAK